MPTESTTNPSESNTPTKILPLLLLGVAATTITMSFRPAEDVVEPLLEDSDPNTMSNIVQQDDSIEILGHIVDESGGGENDPPPPPPPASTTASSGNLSSPRRAISIRRKELASKDLLTDDQIDLVLQDLAEEEKTTLLGAGLGKQTWSRYLVEKYFQHYKWYNPNRDNPDAPKLSKGWAYFEHFTLPRRFVSERGGHQIRAPPGEARTTKLYSTFMTPQESFSDWGIGMGMYFSSLSAVFIIFILAGSLNVANMIYYSSDNYDPGPEGDGRASTSLVDMLQFSAICTAREWVVCSEGCLGQNKTYWDNIFTNSYYGTAIDPNTGEEVVLINRTTCMPAELQQGMINYATLMLLILCMSLYMWYLKKREIRFDEDNTSAADYTVVVHNPPGDAVDPDEWRDFFDQYSESGVTLVTVALNNEMLLNKLVQRRRDIKTLRTHLPAKAELDFDDEQAMDVIVENAKKYREAEEEKRNCLSKLLGCFCTPLLRCMGFSLPEDVIWERIKSTTVEIRSLQLEEYNAAAIFVTFETEEGQRTALTALNASQMSVMTNTALNLDSSSLFRGKVLRVEEASEPNAVRWRDLHYGRLTIYLRLLVTFCITCGLVLFSAFILQISRTRVSTILFSVILSTFNSIIPIIVRILVAYEKHYFEGSIQASLYLKITFFRWINACVITRIITPFLVTLGANKIDLINTINALMISEMVVSPLLRYFDFFTILNRHFFAPRAKTEEELYGYFNGGWYNLAERFTDFTKVLLLCTFYAAFYPLIYFLGAGIIFGQYWMDKFLLLRSWQRAPYFGPEAAKFSRTYFNTAAILLGAISSAFAYASSPFTNLCSCNENGKECAIGGTEYSNVKLLNASTIETPIETSEEAFYFCNQDISDFPPIPTVQGSDKWMTDSQEQLASIYGWTCFTLLILYCVGVLGEGIFSGVLSLVKGMYKPRGVNQHKDFSSGIGLESFAYIPQLEVPGFHFPLLASNIDDIDVHLIGWKDPNCHNDTDPHRNYDNHNLIFDVPNEKLHRSRNKPVDSSSKLRDEGKARPIFSVVKHYPPDWALRLRENNES